MWNSHPLDLNTPSQVKNWVAFLKSKPQNKLNLFKAICLMKIGKSTYSIHVNLLYKFTFAKYLEQLSLIKVSYVDSLLVSTAIRKSSFWWCTSTIFWNLILYHYFPWSKWAKLTPFTVINYQQYLIEQKGEKSIFYEVSIGVRIKNQVQYLCWPLDMPINSSFKETPDCSNFSKLRVIVSQHQILDTFCVTIDLCINLYCECWI